MSGVVTEGLAADMPNLIHIIQWKTIELDGALFIDEFWGVKGHAFRKGPFASREECRDHIKARADKYVKVFFKEFSP